MKKRIIAIIPARKGSKGIINKNIRKINGKPLISWTIEAAKKVNSISDIVVSTDSKDIAKVSIKNGAKIPFMRPKKYSRDHSLSIDLVMNILNKTNYIESDYVILLQPTSPFRNYQHINQAIKIFSKDKKANSLVSVCEVPHNFNFEKLGKIDKGYLNCKTKIRNRQKIEKIYARNGAIYLARYEKYRGSLLISKIIPFIMNPKDSIDIDNMHDWEIAESILK